MAEKTNALVEVNKSLAEYLKLGYHVPGVTVLTELPQFMRPSIRIVQIDTRMEKGKTSNDEIYSVGGGKYAFGRLAIQHFAAAGRIDLKIVGSVVVQRGRDMHRYSARISGERFELDGAPKRLEDEKAYDLDVRAEEIRRSYEAQVESDHKNWSPDRKVEYVDELVKRFMILKQKFAPEMAITGAQGRVVTKMLGLKPAYTLMELQKAFVIIAVTPVVDMCDPDIKRIVTCAMMGIRDTLYPAPTAAPVYPDIFFMNRDTDITEGPVLTLPDEPALVSAEQPVKAEGLSTADFDDCPRATKVSILRRLVKDDDLKKNIGGMGDTEILALYRGLRKVA
jgi:hypothetical protein